MRKVLILVVLLFPMLGLAQDCEQYKTGVFKCKLIDGDWIPNYKIIRRKKIQIERSPEGYNKSKVVWIDDCTYKLIHIKSNYMNLKKGNVTMVRIVKTTDNGYEAIGTSDTLDGSKRIVMKRIN